MSTEGIFDIFTVPALFQKLQHDCQRVISDPSDRWSAIDFVLTADSLRHWAVTDSSGRIRGNGLEVQICRELANRAKHWRTWSQQVRESVSIGSAFQWNAFSPGFQRGSLVVILDGDSAKRFGPEISIEDLATKTMEFWRGELDL